MWSSPLGLEPVAPLLILIAQNADEVRDAARVVLGAVVRGGRRGVVAPHLSLHRPPHRHRLRDDVTPVDMDEDEVAAQDVVEGGPQVVAGPVRKSGGAVEDERHLVPHQLSAPHPVGRATEAEQLIAPLLRGAGVGGPRIERGEQCEHRLVGDALEPLPRLR